MYSPGQSLTIVLYVINIESNLLHFISYFYWPTYINRSIKNLTFVLLYMYLLAILSVERGPLQRLVTDSVQPGLWQSYSCHVSHWVTTVGEWAKGEQWRMLETDSTNEHMYEQIKSKWRKYRKKNCGACLSGVPQSGCSSSQVLQLTDVGCKVKR